MRRELLIAIFLIIVAVAVYVYLSVQKPAQPALACPKECAYGCLLMTTKCKEPECPSSCPEGCIAGTAECKPIIVIPDKLVNNCEVINDSLGLNHGLSSEATCLVIQSDNIALDCRGYSITGSLKGGSYGIYIDGRNNVTIANCLINNYDSGIVVNSSWGILLMNVELDNNLNDGALVTNSTGLLMEGVNATSNGNSGLEISSSSVINLTESNISQSPFGVHITLSNGTALSNDWICSSLMIDAWCEGSGINSSQTVSCDNDEGCALGCSPCSMYTSP